MADGGGLDKGVSINPPNNPIQHGLNRGLRLIADRGREVVDEKPSGILDMCRHC